MRKFLSLLLVAGLLVSPAHALKKKDSQEIPSTSILKNTGAEQGLTGFSVTAGTLVTDTATPGEGLVSLSWDPSATGEFLRSTLTAMPISHRDRNCEVRFRYNFEGTVGDITAVVDDGTTDLFVAESLEATASGKWALFQKPFQCPGTGSLRLELESTADAAIVKVDSIYIGTSLNTVVTNTSDWIAYTPTGSWTTNTTYVGRTRRVGDTKEYQVTVILSGAPNAVGLSINQPSGESIDSTKLSDTDLNSNAIGTVRVLELGTSSTLGVVRYSSDILVELRAMANGSGSVHDLGGVSSTVPFTFGSGDRVDIDYRVPIQGFSSNFAFSEDGPNVAAKYQVSGATANPGLATGATEVIDYDNVVYDTHSAVTTGASWVFTAPVSGKYRVAAAQVLSSGVPAVNDQFNLSIFVNGAERTKLTIWFAPNTTATIPAVNGAVDVDLVVGDTLDIRGFQNIAGTPTFSTSATNLNHVSIHKIGTVVNINEGQVLWAEHILSNDVITGGTITDLTFNNLAVGDTYEWTCQVMLQTNTSDGFVNFRVNHNSVIIGFAQRQHSGGATTNANAWAISGKFKAVVSTLTFSLGSESANSFLRGNGAKDETFCQIEEKPFFLETTEFD